MVAIVIVGGQWGDEGKGKVVDLLSEKADVVIRFQGGHNAGHTLVIDNITYKLSLFPSGIVRQGQMSIIGSEVVLDPAAFMKEWGILQKQNVEISPQNLAIADNVHLILPLHGELDAMREMAKNRQKIGTTKKGIGPAYEDKVGRRGIRLCDLAFPDTLQEKIENLLLHHNALRKGFNVEEIKSQDVFDYLIEFAKYLLPFSVNMQIMMQKYDPHKSNIIFEGAQGALLDNCYGTYPFVTSSNTIAGQIASGASFVKRPDHVLAIIKAYTTRVGMGPFPTEQDNAVGDKLGKNGFEFGTVTNRKRRCGWFDAVLVKQSLALNNASSIVFTKIDVLDDFTEIKICTAYEIDGKQYDYLPSGIDKQRQIKPIYETYKGWMSKTANVQNYDQLPNRAKDYIKRIEELISCRVSIISTSPKREDVILCGEPIFKND